MTLRDRLTKNLLFLGLVIYYLGGYFTINWLTSYRSDLHQLPLPFEVRLPFVPELIFAYLLVYVFLSAAYLSVDDLPFFRKIIKSFYLCCTIHFVIFLAFPVEYALRPEILAPSGFLDHLIVFYYWLDLPYNSFPSMHISNVFLVSFFLNRYRPGVGKVLFPAAILVAISVVLVKQHYIVDVIAGFLVGYAVYLWVFDKSPFVKGGICQEKPLQFRNDDQGINLTR